MGASFLFCLVFCGVPGTRYSVQWFAQKEEQASSAVAFAYHPATPFAVASDYVQGQAGERFYS